MGDETAAPLHPDSSMSQSIPVLAIVNSVLRHRVRTLLVVVLLWAVTAALVLSAPLKYVSSASFSLQGSDARRLSGLAAQIGLALPSGDGGQQSPAYYLELLESREILSQASAAVYVDTVNGRPVRTALAEAYRIKGTDTATVRDDVIKALREAVTTSKSRETGIVHVSVTAPSPRLARQLLTRLLELLSDFNLKTRQSQAANERRFVEQRLTGISAELRTAEDRLQDFLLRNRGGAANAPELSFQRERLQREVMLRQQLHNSLAQNYEQARIDEVRDTPALTIIEAPNLPVRRAPRGLLRALILATALGLALGVLPLTLGVLLSRKPRSLAAEVVEFRRLRQELRTAPLAGVRNGSAAAQDS